MSRTVSDDELLAACAAGDEQALGSLYERFGRLAYGVALRVLRDAGLAEDAVQEAFLTVWRQAAAFDRCRGSATTWILTLVHRRAVDLVRSEAGFHSRHARLQARDTATVAPVDDDAALRVARMEVRAALATLPGAEREVITLAYWYGLTQSEIATALGIPLGTVKSRTFTALTRLREALGRPPEALDAHAGAGVSARSGSGRPDGGVHTRWHACVLALG